MSAESIFFSLNANYLIAPGASLNGLLNDCNCLLESGIGGLAEAGRDDYTHGQWASSYALEQAQALFAEIYRRVMGGESVHVGETP